MHNCVMIKLSRLYLSFYKHDIIPGFDSLGDKIFSKKQTYVYQVMRKVC